MIALILLKLFLFCSILFVFGWQLARFILNEKRIEALIPLAAILGFSIYLFFLNVFSYFIDITVNFYLLCVIFIFLSWLLSRVNRKKGKTEWGIGKKWRIILFGTAALIIVCVGIAGMRYISSDETGSPLPMAATIAEGNFPVKEVSAPNFLSQYHYGYVLLSAAVSKITNLPVWFCYDFQNAIFMGLVFLLGFLLIRDFCKDNFRAYLASLIMVLGGNLNFLYGTEGLSSLYQKYILHLPVEAPFKFLNDMIFGGVMRGVLVLPLFQLAWVMLGFALTITVSYLYFKAINDEKNWFKISCLAGIIFSFLALSAEIFFGVFCAVFLIYPLIFAFLKKDWRKGRFYLKISLLILFLGITIASFQGGVLTQSVKQTFFGSVLPMERSLSITPEYLLSGVIFIEENVFIPIFSSNVFLGWGWLIIFIIPATFYVLKKYFQQGLFLILLVFVSFFLPLVVTAGASSQGDFMRLHFLTSIFWNLIFGLFLGWLLLSRPFFSGKGAGWQKLLIIILILGVIFQGLLYLVVSPVFPQLERGHPLLEEPAKPSRIELEVFDWVREHTTIKDCFLTFGEESILWHNSRFIIYTGRFAPGFFYGIGAQFPKLHRGIEKRIPETIWYEKVLKECPADGLEALNYRYLYVNEYWPQGLEEKCLANNDLTLKLEASDGNQFARIYEVGLPGQPR
ncbi:MAG: hypothetical protein ABIG29_02420 [Candidatus Nealsonbacteria bacterium]